MKALLQYIENNRNTFNIPGGKLFLELHAPWRLSRTSRSTYKVRSETNSRYHLIFQDGISLQGIRCLQNPFEPEFHHIVNSFLPGHRGSINIDGLVYFWSDFMEGSSLGTNMRSNKNNTESWLFVSYLAKLIGELQKQSAHASADFLSKLKEITRRQINDTNLFSLYEHAVDQYISILTNWPNNACSWSHGDLWTEDIIVNKELLCIIDWEWALSVAPIGADLIDLYITSAEHVLSIPTEQAWLSFFTNKITQLQPLAKEISVLWSSVGFKQDDCKRIVIYTLIRSAGRVIAQEGYEGFPLFNTYLNLASILLNNHISLFNYEQESVRTSNSTDIREQSMNLSEGSSAVPQLSIITPTLNRADLLKLLIKSFVGQDISPEQFEIIVVDNGSSDSTRQEVEAAIANNKSHIIRYVHEPEPGLLSGRHRGALEAKGKILVFTDDDIEATPHWLSAIANTFEDPDVHLVGGPSLPLFETMPPQWIIPYCSIRDEHLTCGSLSLLDLGDQIQQVDPINIWGLNFAIRKKTLFELGGFHPDCIPKHLQQFQGDGETGLSFKIREAGYKAIYHPNAMVYHIIPSGRLTVEYFENRFFYQGVCDSYTAIRKLESADSIACQTYNPTDSRIPPYPEFTEIYRRIHKAYIDGFNFHLTSVKKSQKLLEWVLKEDYFDYKLPDIENIPVNER
jgi:glucosyl-dolichyl phosphate glucuronosyltransferase